MICACTCWIDDTCVVSFHLSHVPSVSARSFLVGEVSHDPSAIFGCSIDRNCDQSVEICARPCPDREVFDKVLPIDVEEGGTESSTGSNVGV